LLTLTNPAIDVQDFEELLVPFLETYLLFNFENEYRQSLSIFAPIQDAIERSGLAEEDIDLCLLAGGSCLIPQVRMALEEFFTTPSCSHLKMQIQCRRQSPVEPP